MFYATVSVTGLVKLMQNLIFVKTLTKYSMDLDFLLTKLIFHKKILDFLGFHKLSSLVYQPLLDLSLGPML